MLKQIYTRAVCDTRENEENRKEPEKLTRRLNRIMDVESKA